VFLCHDDENWWSKSGLSNWWNTQGVGYAPANRFNVEWTQDVCGSTSPSCGGRT
jgi:hypothetical protein